jgi:DeoR family transcriptional regulator of aga operon
MLLYNQPLKKVNPNYMSGLIKEERLNRILQVIQKDGHAMAGDLARNFGVSEITIRRDLSELDEKGFVRRAHGGAIISTSMALETPIIHRLVQEKECKQAIARTAASMINDGESVFIGSGSTAAYVAHYLTNHKHLTVVTNALNISTDLATAEEITVVVLGGMMRHEELSLIGHIAEQSLNEVTIDKVIIGIPAVDLVAGLTNDYLPEVITDRTILNRAREVILVADHTKCGKVASAFVAPLNRVNLFITDAYTPPEFLEGVQAQGVNVIVAENGRLGTTGHPQHLPEGNNLL